MPDFKGRIISKSQAEDEISQYLIIRKGSYNKIKTAVTGDPEAERYFGDTEVSFVFHKDFVDALTTLAGSKGCNAVRVYYGAAPEDEGDIKKGSTTVVLVAAKITEDAMGNITRVENVWANESTAAIQYPGGCRIPDTTQITINLADDIATTVHNF